MARVNALVITGYGTNCEQECAHSVKKAGANDATIVHFSDISRGLVRMEDFNYLIFPGGFLDGDDLGAAQAAAHRWRWSEDENGKPVLDQLKAFFDAGGVILGICNGFQLMVKLGLLPAVGGRYFERQVSLSYNDSNKYEDRWVTLKANPDSHCVFTKDIDTLYVPVRHGEGKIIASDEKMLDELSKSQQIALQYIHPETGEVSMEYPYNPNGSPMGIAGLTDPSGRILGLMPHPEAFNHPTNHPHWTRGDVGTLGTALLEGGVRYLKEK